KCQDSSISAFEDNPPNEMFWYPSIIFTKSHVIFAIANFFFHYIPALLADGICIIAGETPRMLKTYRTMQTMIKATAEGIIVDQIFIFLNPVDNFKQAQTGAERFLERSEFELTDAEAVVHIPGRVLRKQVQNTSYKIPKNNHTITVGINEVEPDAAVNVLGLPEFEVGSFLHEFSQDSSSIQRPSIIPEETESITSPFIQGDLTSISKNQPEVEFIACAGIEAKLEKLFAELQN
ncbi:unnamed protein product, partial [Allacma fusca]